jgi:hypothetical protein
VTTPLPSGRSAARNGFWALASQLSNLLFNGLFAIVLAQFVSVSEFGVFNYAISLASLGMAVMSAGLYGLAIREYHSHPELSSRITGSVILIREVMATCAYVVLLVVSASSAGPAAFTGAAIACLGILARVFDAPELWFQANLKAKTPAIVKISVACVFFGARLVILFAEPNVFLILALFAAEQLFNAVAIFFFYLRATPHRPRLSLSLRGTRALARQSMPLMISTIANQVKSEVRHGVHPGSYGEHIGWVVRGGKPHQRDPLHVTDHVYERHIPSTLGGTPANLRRRRTIQARTPTGSRWSILAGRRICRHRLFLERRNRRRFVRNRIYAVSRGLADPCPCVPLRFHGSRL